MDQIKALLLQTGWSCEELIKNINEFKHNIVEDTTKVTNDSTIKINGQCGEVAIDSEANDTGCKSNDTDSGAGDPPQHISFDEVENDHSYTCRMDNDRNSEEAQKEVKIDIKEACKYTANCIRRYLLRKRRIFKRKFNYTRKLKHRYRLLSKNALTDRKMLICKYKSKEVVRNEIMHQLELLRSKRTLGISSGIKQTVISEQVFLKKRYSGDKSKEGVGCSEMCKESPLGITEISDDDTPPTLSIAEQKEDTTEDKQDFYSIKPTKTNDITKIKGWKNKKFTSINSRLKIDEYPKICEVTDVNTLKLKSPITAKGDPKSAFASTNLDGFLHDSANLYISFDIPTLDSGGNESSTNTIVKAEEPLVKTQPIFPATSASSADDNLEDELLKVVKVDTVNLYRPRTLGQKRRIWKLKADTRMKRKTEEVVAKPRTLAEKRRMLDCGMDAKSKLKNVESGDGTLKYSYVLHRGRRLRIPTRSESGLIASIKSHNGRKDYIYVPKKVRPIKMKPSIFATTLAQQSQTILSESERRAIQRIRYQHKWAHSNNSPHEGLGASDSSSDSQPEPPGKRILHNSMERLRRRDIRNALEDLRVLVPRVNKKKSASKVAILREAALYCYDLGDISDEMCKRKDELKLKQECLRAKLSQLLTTLVVKHR